MTRPLAETAPAHEATSIVGHAGRFVLTFADGSVREQAMLAFTQEEEGGPLICRAPGLRVR